MPESPSPATERVCAVVVTFNRRALLGGCLRSLLAQTRKLDEILVVDNASSDGTPAMLAAEFPEVRVLRLPANTGGAGGFHAGMKWAYLEGFDWIWTMDDDIEMGPETLEVMLKYRAVSDFIHVRKMTPEGPLVWEATWDVSRALPSRFPVEVGFEAGREWVPMQAGNFEGALIHRRVVELAGYPDPRFFFHLDDTLYGFLASLKTLVIYVNHFGIRKMVRAQPPSRMVYYLRIRNNFLAFEYLKKAGLKMSPGLFKVHICHLALSSFRQILSSRPGKQTALQLQAVLQGILHGWRGRFGPPPWIGGGTSIDYDAVVGAFRKKG
jgi:GT2 family glycosyltransferase